MKRASVAAALILACGGAWCITSPTLAAETPVMTAQADVTAEKLGDKIAAFYASDQAKTDALPSFALIVPRKGAAGDAGVTLKPAFTSKEGKSVATIAIAPKTCLYGTGEVSGPLLRNGHTVTMWNTDAYAYDEKVPHLYQSHPWVLGVREDGTSFGILADTTYRLDIALPALTGGDITLTSDGPAFPVIVIERSSPQEVLKALATLTGTMPLPPEWALGYHQCRYSYFPDTRVQEVANEFRKRRIPCDVIWHDIDYMHKFLCFTFDEKYFPNPTAHNDALHKLGFHTVWMIDPGIGKDEKSFPGGKYPVYESGGKIDAWVKKADGSTYVGDVWPGPCVFPDFLRKDTRAWWAGLYKDWIATGVDGVWNDMNEPAIFNTPNNWKTMPLDNVHRADAELGGTGPHARYHNVFGMEMIRATREGIQAARPDKRPFVLSRANYLGGQRYGATWTGDNVAEWKHLEWAVPMALNVSLSGQPFIGPDIGGFSGNGPQGSEGPFFARFMSFGALLPFSRGHTAKGNIDKEPWAFGPEVEASCRTAIERRYRLLPYLYTLFREASTTGMPVARPIFFADLKDFALRSEDDGFLLGSDLMVVAQMVPDRTRVPVLPRSGWTKFTFEGEKVDDNQTDLYIRQSSIVPTGPVMQYVGEKPLDEVTLLVALDDKGQATGTLYEDAGDGYGYQTGEYALTTFTAKRDGDKVTVSTSKDGKMEVRHSLKVVVLK